MNDQALSVFIFSIGITLTLTGFLSSWILSRISGDIKTALTQVQKHETLIQLMDMKIEAKMDKLECNQRHSECK